MMDLRIQIFCLFFSFVFGVFLYLLYRFIYCNLYRKNNIKRFLLLIFLTVCISLLFFLILRNINDGILHYYFLLLIIFGFLMGYTFDKKV